MAYDIPSPDPTPNERMKQIFRYETAVVIGGQVVQLLLSFVSGIIVARMLGSGGYGVFNILRNLFLAVAMLAPLGLDVALLKYCGKSQLDDAHTLEIVRKLRFIAAGCNSLVALIVGFGLAGPLMRTFYPYQGFDTLLAVTMLGLPISADLAIIGAVFKSRGEAGTYAVFTLYLQALARVVMVVLAALLSPTLLTIICINVIQLAMSAIAIFHYERRNAKPAHATALDRRAPAAWREVLPVLNDSQWMALSMFVYGMMRFVDILMLGSYVSARDVGEYAALSTISQLVQMYPIAASQSLGPTVSRLHHAGNPDGVRKALGDYIYLASIVSSFIFAGIAIFGERLDLVFGQSYVFQPAVCVIIPLGYMLSATLAPTGFALSMTGRHKQELLVLCIGSLSLIVLCRLLIPSFGQLGAASAVALAFAFTNILRFIYVSKIIGFLPGRLADFAPPVVALAVAVFARHFGDRLGDRSLSTTFLSCLIYTAVFATVAYFALLRSETRAKIVAIAGKRRWMTRA